jgi:hypothetical protein
MTTHTHPPEVQATRHIHAHLFVAAHAALLTATDYTPRSADRDLEGRYAATLGHNVSWCLHREMAARLRGQVSWHKDRGFVAMIPKGLGVAIRLGRCDEDGKPDERERDPGTPFAEFMRGEPLLFGDNDLVPIFAGYSLHRFERDGELLSEVDRFVLAKYVDDEHVWSWGLDPADPGRLPSALAGNVDELKIVPKYIPVPRQTRIG